jgi:hypothetical protein
MRAGQATAGLRFYNTWVVNELLQTLMVLKKMKNILGKFYKGFYSCNFRGWGHIYNGLFFSQLTNGLNTQERLSLASLSSLV